MLILTKELRRKAVFVFLLVVLLASLPVQTASAALRTCRTDPIVFLSNGMKVSLTASMATDPANVAVIVYELHVPKGAVVTDVVFTGGEFAKKEVVAVRDDQQAGVYKSDTIVIVHSGMVDVTASTMLLIGVGNTAKGRSGEHLRLELRDPGTAPRSTLSHPVR